MTFSLGNCFYQRRVSDIYRESIYNVRHFFYKTIQKESQCTAFKNVWIFITKKETKIIKVFLLNKVSLSLTTASESPMSAILNKEISLCPIRICDPMPNQRKRVCDLLSKTWGFACDIQLLLRISTTAGISCFYWCINPLYLMYTYTPSTLTKTQLGEQICNTEAFNFIGARGLSFSCPELYLFKCSQFSQSIV